MGGLRLTIDSNLGDVALAAVAINKVCMHLGLDDIQASQVELCIAEAVTNAIRHAYHGKQNRTVSILVSTGMNQLHFEICDDGTPMSPEHIKTLVHGIDIVDVDKIERACLPEGGRGLQIIHDLMDEAAYIRCGSLNCLQLIKNITRDKVE